MQTYREFLFLVNLSHKMFDPLNIYEILCLSKNEKNLINKYYYYVGPGNNSSLIRSLMKKRIWWFETKNITEAHFVWTQIKVESVFEKQVIGEKKDGRSELKELEEWIKKVENESATPKK